MNGFYDIVIIGAGPSGMAAAITAKRDDNSLSILVVEKKEKVGTKLSLTGNGKCNITNMNAKDSDIAIDFLKSLGLDIIEKDEGRLYPKEEDANLISKKLFMECKKLGIEMAFNSEVKSIDKTCGQGFFLTFQNGKTVGSDKLLISTGGKSYPKTGTTGDGFIFARSLGHQVNTLIPGLTGVETDDNTENLHGIRSKGTVKLYRDDEKIFEESGEVQFRSGVISGIVVMNMSLLYRNDGKKYVMELDLHGNPKLGDKVLRLTLKNLRGWKEAQITCGGVKLDELSESTLESKITPKLYFSGEVLDFQGPCGGYNLNNAWVSGIKVGHAMAKNKNIILE